MKRGEREDLLVPPDVRRAVIERDGGDETGGVCRICGQWVNTPAVHHVVFKSHGGLNVVGNLVTVGWLPWEHDCHLPIAHGSNARLWRELLLELLQSDDAGLTALQLRRWKR